MPLTVPSSASDAGRRAACFAIGTVVGIEGVGTKSGFDAIDNDFSFNVQEGDRAAVFGRLIADAGHNHFNDGGYCAEIHPPLMLATARVVQVNQRATTRALFTSRPYLSGQTLCESPDDDPYVDGQNDDGSLKDHLESEVIKVETFRSSALEAHPKVKSKPFDGVHLLHFVVRPPRPPGHLDTELNLQISFRFTLRSSCSASPAFCRLSLITSSPSSLIHFFLSLLNDPSSHTPLAFVHASCAQSRWVSGRLGAEAGVRGVDRLAGGAGGDHGDHLVPGGDGGGEGAVAAVGHGDRDHGGVGVDSSYPGADRGCDLTAGQAPFELVRSNNHPEPRPSLRSGRERWRAGAALRAR